MIALLAAVVVAATTAAPAPRAVDPAALTAANALVQQLDVRGQITTSMARNVELMRSGVALRAMLAQQPGFVPAYRANRAKFDPVLKKAGGIQAGVAEKVIQQNINGVVAAAAQAYARNYSAAELKALSDFYRTPLGTALRDRQPRVTAEIGQATGQIMGAKVDAAMQAASPQISAALAPLNSAPAGAAPPKK